MRLLSNIRNKRRTIAAILVAWLFALASSWAYACLLEHRGVRADDTSAAASAGIRAPIVSAGYVGAIADDDTAPVPVKDACLKVCDEVSQTVLQLPTSLDLTSAAMAPPVAFAWMAQWAAAMMDRSTLARPAPGSVLPLRTRFSRLAL
jgi:hypothetical protein